MKEDKVIEMEVEEVVEDTLVSKVKTTVKKHWKKIAVGAAVVTGVVVGCKIKNGAFNSFDTIELDDADVLVNEIAETIE